MQVRFAALRQAIDTGTPDEIWDSATRFEEALDQSDLSGSSLAIATYNLGVGFERLAGRRPDAAVRGYACQRSAVRRFRDLVIGGETVLAGNWVEALRSLALICLEGVTAIDVSSVRHVANELDVCRSMLEGSEHAPRLGSAYCLIAAAQINSRAPGDSRWPELAAVAVQMCGTAIELLGPVCGTPENREHVRARITLCACLAASVERVADLIWLTETCVATHEWLVSIGAHGDRFSPEHTAAEAVLATMNTGVITFLRISMHEGRQMLARVAVSLLLKAARPELWDFEAMIAAMERWQAEGRVREMDLLEQWLVELTADALRAVDSEQDVESATQTLWPPPPTLHLAAALSAAGASDELIAVICAQNEARRFAADAGKSTEEELRVLRFARLISWSSWRPEAPLQEMEEQAQDLLGDDIGPDAAVDRLGVVATAAILNAGLWPVADLEAALELVDSWRRTTGQRYPEETRFSEAQLTLLGHLVTHSAGNVRRLIERAGAVASRLETMSAAPSDDEIWLYARAIGSLGFAARVVGEGHVGEEAREALLERARRFFERWVTDEADRASHLEGIDIQLGRRRTVGEAAERLVDAVGHVSDSMITRAWLMLEAVSQEPDLTGHGVEEAVELALRLIAGSEVDASRTPTGGAFLLARVLEHQSIKIPSGLALRVLAFGLELARQRQDEPLDAVLVLTLAAERHNEGDEDTRRHMRLRERIAEYVFASPSRVATLSPQLCGLFLSRCAFAGEPFGAVADDERVGRLFVAFTSLGAASAGEDPLAHAVGLWALADRLRWFGNAAEPLYDALGELLAGTPQDAISDEVRWAIERDLAIFHRAEGASRRPGGESRERLAFNTLAEVEDDLYVRAMRLYAVRRGRGAGDAALEASISSLVAEIDSGSHSDAQRASWLLAAAQAASYLDEPMRRAAHRELTAALLRVGCSTAVPDVPLSLPMFEYAVFHAILAEDSDLASAALECFRAAVNEALLVANDIESLIVEIGSNGVLEKAAVAAFRRKMSVGLEIAESGRAKLLTALATGLLPTFEDSRSRKLLRAPVKDGLRRVGQQQAAELFEGFLEGAVKNPIAAWRECLTSVGGTWSDTITSMLQPWPRLAFLAEDRAPTRSSSRLERRGPALQDPLIPEMVAWTGLGCAAVWAVGCSDDPYLAFLLPGERLMFVGPEVDDLDGADPGVDDSASAVVRWWAQRSPAMRRAYLAWKQIQEDIPKLQRIVVIDCARSPDVAVDVGHGVSLAAADSRAPAVIPSFRFIQRQPRPAPPVAREVTVLANPTGDLAGCFLEAVWWSVRCDLLPTIHLHAEATCGAFIEGLCTSRLVVVAGHGATDDLAGAVLRLADGIISIDELLELDGAICAERVVISSCWGAGRSTTPRTRREHLGVASCLLSLGVQQIVASTSPVSDLASAAMSWEFAARYGADTGLGGTYVASRLALANSDPAVRVDAMRAALAAEIASGRVRPLPGLDLEGVLDELATLSRSDLMDASLEYGLLGDDDR